eukprot:m.80144 g.80144  ORF g.80144 m.80144 type:complete len:524 (-) comp12005_c0_seq1:4013-5584(-)
MLKTIGKVLLGAGIAFEVFDTQFRYSRLNRNIKTVVGAVQTVYDYKIYLDRHPEEISEVHKRVASRWYNICRSNGGLYIKLGQAISMQNHVLPPEYANLFSQLQDQAPTVGYDEVEKIFKREYGALPTDMFQYFNPVPVASASIAQVHYAELKDGTPVAVKVQKPNIEYQMPWDLFCYRALVYFFDKSFDLPMYFTVDNVCESLTREGDFLSEAVFTKQARDDMTNVPNAYVPFIYDDLTTTRVMVMEWIDGVKLSSHKEIQAMGFSLRDVMTTVFNAFSYQIFISGYVHGDPHPGNVFVRRNPNFPKEHQIVILDHGLYNPERESFRQSYCKLWVAMVLTDKKSLEEVCSSWGVMDPDLFASFQLFKPFKSSGNPVHIGKASRKDMLEVQVAAKERVRLLLSDTSKLPLELVILGRTMNILRGNNKQAGSIVNRVNLFARRAVQGLYIHRSTGMQLFERFKFSTRLFLIEAVYRVSNFVSWIRELVGLRDVRFETLLENQMANALESKLGFKVGVVKDGDIG